MAVTVVGSNLSFAAASFPTSRAESCVFSQQCGLGSSVSANQMNYNVVQCRGSTEALDTRRRFYRRAVGNLPNFSFAEQVGEVTTDFKKLSFWERFSQAWNVLFPPKRKASSNAEIAKQRLRMILIADRCAVSDEAKRKIVSNIIDALSNFVEIESEEKVQLNVATDPNLGTVYSVTVPVRRVKPEYQDYNDQLRNIDLGEGLGGMRTCDVTFEYPEAKRMKQ